LRVQHSCRCASYHFADAAIQPAYLITVAALFGTGNLATANF